MESPSSNAKKPATTSNFMLMELLEKYFNQNPWYDLTNLDELIKLTGLDEASLRVIIPFWMRTNISCHEIIFVFIIPKAAF